MENVSYKAPTFLRKLAVLFVVVIIDKEADITSVTCVTLPDSTAKPQGCQKLASRHGRSFKWLFPFPANVLKLLVKVSCANNFLASGSENSMSASRRD